MNDQQKSTRRGRFNVIDALILFLVIALVVVMVYMMFFSDYPFFDNLQNNSQNRVVRYTLEIAPVEDAFFTSDGTLPLLVGDTLYHLDGKYVLGEVVQIGERRPYRTSTGEYLPDEEGVNTLQYAEYPGKSSVLIQVESQAVWEGNAYLVNGKALYAGDTFAFNTPYFTGNCRCVSVEEVTENE